MLIHIPVLVPTRTLKRIPIAVSVLIAVLVRISISISIRYDPP